LILASALKLAFLHPIMILQVPGLSTLPPLIVTSHCHESSLAGSPLAAHRRGGEIMENVLDTCIKKNVEYPGNGSVSDNVALQKNNRGGSFKILYLRFCILNSRHCLYSLLLRVVNSWIDLAGIAELSCQSFVISEELAPSWNVLLQCQPSLTLCPIESVTFAINHQSK
jgi:hypothetical protein